MNLLRFHRLRKRKGCPVVVQVLCGQPSRHEVGQAVDVRGGLAGEAHHEAEHLGVAVDSERGLLVPVIRDAGDLNIAGLARRIADLAKGDR